MKPPLRRLLSGSRLRCDLQVLVGEGEDKLLPTGFDQVVRVR